MLWHAIAPVRRYTKASHDVVRHPRLCSDAKILLLYVQGLPDEQTHLALSEHARKLGIKGRAFQRAKEQLIVNGFVHERRVSGERGLWVTQQLFSNVPLSDADALGVWREAGVGGDPSPGAHFPAVGRPGPRTVGRQLPVGEEREKNSSHPPTEPPHVSEALVELSPEEAEAERVLLSLRHVDRQLRLGVAEARELVRLAVEWLRRGVSGSELRRVLSGGLPSEGVRSAVGFLGHRLVKKMPEVPEIERQPLSAAPVVVPPYVPAPLVTCQGPGTEHVFRAMAGETECPDCQQAAAWARWAERRAADLGVDLAEDAAKAVEDGRDPGGWRGRLAAAAGATGAAGAPGGQ
ncbi:hypothetical protein ACTFBT_18965 [Streptomyces microflavus]|uniref:Helix-turn-helix domain-containing protein n=1 Tax=Streptomyces microflavus TaxID=1919 RepID=A0A7J0CRS5_STRMI|nr:MULTISPECIES: hypothetical protein [Streptomyces]MDX2979644.1 hypothetical protein [Streptomyces sp. NRRL_B-2249]GFN05226.1 hypothetical protein Smic_37820 [Streptomyces microflavus]GGX51367.1 hypothetical protein GCM10010298_13850 [Streptomyces microflavus]